VLRPLAIVVLLVACSARAQANELKCLIEPRRSVLVSASVIGVVDSVKVERSDFVEKGQLVATLESSMQKAAVALAEYRAMGVAEVQSATARLQLGQRRLERGVMLRGENVMSAEELEEIEAEVQLAEADLIQAQQNRRLFALELDQAKAALGLRSIASPVSGVVVKLLLHEGEYADPPQLMEIAEIDPLRVEAYAPVALLGQIGVGSVGYVTMEGPQQRSFTAAVTMVDGVVDAASATFGVRLELPNPDHEVLAGLGCKVEFESQDAAASAPVPAPPVTAGDPVVAR